MKSGKKSLGQRLVDSYSGNMKEEANDLELPEVGFALLPTGSLMIELLNNKRTAIVKSGDLQRLKSFLNKGRV